MSYETVVKRTIWVAECDCQPEDRFRKIYTENPPRECQCPNCKKWVEPKEESYAGKDRFDKK